MELKPGMIIRWTHLLFEDGDGVSRLIKQDEPLPWNPNYIIHERCWMVLDVNRHEFRNRRHGGILNVDHIGLHAFGGMWYGRNPLKIKSYGKVIPIYNRDYIEIVKENIIGMSVDEIQKLVN
mgnify:CR=1 FL=1